MGFVAIGSIKMRDFTTIAYRKLLVALKDQGYYFFTFEKFINTTQSRAIALRHDVDQKPKNSLAIARLEKSVGIISSYYFRAVPVSFNEDTIKEIAGLGHEVGYHYETMDTCRGDIDKAYDEFCRNLEMFRKIIPIHTICMHGSPLSKWDNRGIWEKYDYKKLGIKAEPFLDLSFEDVLYLTDTGRRWDGDKVSVRDKVKEARLKGQGLGWSNLKLRKTMDIIEAAEKGSLPDKIMLNTHPQRWTNNPLAWTKELVWQGIKNQVKRVVVNISKR